MLAKRNHLLGALSPLRELQQTMDGLFDELYRTSFPPGSNRSGQLMGESMLLPPINMYRRGQDIVVECALPGVRKEDIDISLQDNTLLITGDIKPLHLESTDKSKTGEIRDEHFLHREVRHGSFERLISLPNEVKADSVQAKFEDGILRITLQPMVARVSQRRQIQIT